MVPRLWEGKPKRVRATQGIKPQLWLDPGVGLGAGYGAGDGGGGGDDGVVVRLGCVWETIFH